MEQLITLGGCAIDLISHCDYFPIPGETVIGYDFVKGFGGKAASQTVMAAKLGLSTAIISKVGDDSFGREYVKYLKELNINIGQNCIVYTPGAADLLTAADVARAEPLFSDNKNGSLKLAMATFEAPESALVEFLKMAKKYKVQTLVTGAPWPTVEKTMDELCPLMDIFCLNETKLSAAVGFPVDEDEDIEFAFEHLIEHGCQNVVATKGKDGARLALKNESSYTIHNIICPAYHEVDTLGAGDALVGSLAYLLVCRPNTPRVYQVCQACGLASISVTKEGRHASFPSLDFIPKNFFN